MYDLIEKNKIRQFESDRELTQEANVRANGLIVNGPVVDCVSHFTPGSSSVYCTANCHIYKS